MKRIYIASLLLLFSTGLARGADIVGSARALNGDTLELDGQVVRLYGIQAPHPKQTCRTHKGQVQQCGQIATLGLAALVRGPKIRCEAKGTNAQGEALAACFVGWMNVAEEMVASGYAVADPLTGADFQRAEAFAKARKEGLWRTEFTNPWEWVGE